jgi:hypothetical protein
MAINLTEVALDLSWFRAHLSAYGDVDGRNPVAEIGQGKAK